MNAERGTRLCGAAVVAMSLLAMVGCARNGAGRQVTSASEPPTTASASPAPGPAPVERLAAGPTRGATPTSAPAAPTTAAAAPASKRTIAPSRNPQPLPPPPPPAHRPDPAPTPTCRPSYTGPVAERAAVRAGLDDVAKQHFYWKSAPTISVPANLLYAVAWQESGWQSTIMACDGGIGTMQVMPSTVQWLKDEFGTDYDPHTLKGNTMLGGEYLTAMVRYFGDNFYGGNYDLSNENLLNNVISAYNMGPGGVDPMKGADGIQNWRYVNNVKALMTNCPCLN